MTACRTRRTRTGLVHVTAIAAAVAALAGCSSASGGSGTPGAATRPAGSPAAGAPTGQPAGVADSGASTAPPGAATAGIDDTYYPVAVGNTWVYQIDYGAASLGVVTDTETMTSVVPFADGNRVAIARRFHYRSGRHPDFVSTVTYLFHRDGSLTVPYQTGIQAAGTSIAVRSGSIVWPTPQDLAGGRSKTGRVEVTVSAAGRRMDADVDVTVRGTGTGAVTVPAGSYPSARILQQDLTEHLAGIGGPITITVRSWLVRGVGMVKSSTDLGNAPIDTVLLSFRHG